MSFPEIPVITVGAKSDIARKEGCDVALSSVTGEGIDELKALLFERGFGSSNDEAYLMEERHFFAVEEAYREIINAKEGAENGLPAELYAEDLKAAYVSLGLISGETAAENVIEEIFSKFCVGK